MESRLFDNNSLKSRLNNTITEIVISSIWNHCFERPLKHGTVEPMQTRIVNLTFEKRFGNSGTSPQHQKTKKKPSLDRGLLIKASVRPNVSTGLNMIKKFVVEICNIWP